MLTGRYLPRAVNNTLSTVLFQPCRDVTRQPRGMHGHEDDVLTTACLLFVKRGAAFFHVQKAGRRVFTLAPHLLVVIIIVTRDPVTIYMGTYNINT